MTLYVCSILHSKGAKGVFVLHPLSAPHCICLLCVRCVCKKVCFLHIVFSSHTTQRQQVIVKPKKATTKKTDAICEYICHKCEEKKFSSFHIFYFIISYACRAANLRNNLVLYIRCWRGYCVEHS